MNYYKSLIDGVEVEHDGFCYVYGLDINGRKCRVSSHGGLEGFTSEVENKKVITGGHVYILNYNKDTYISKSPETFEEYLKLKL
tara:strand:+ start:185 stop:436 length:252 start_codon:yes stop_codon:yes gene_type:complete